MSSPSPENAARISKVLFAIGIIIFSAYFVDEKSQDVFGYKLPSSSINTVGTYYKVDRVVDGDTIRILMGEESVPVRLLGINAPESVDPRRTIECFGKEASKKMKSMANGAIVRLEYDDSQGVRDTYNRLLAYVYLEDGQMLNRKMIAEGYAYEYTYLTPYKYQSEFRDLQRFAKASSYGLWAKDSCNGER